MNKKFEKYNSLENYWNLEKTMSLYAKDFNLDRTRTWLVTEKIHGSNVCISNKYKEGPAFFTRRGNQLPADYQEVLRGYDWEYFFKMHPSVDYAYGEIAGPGIQKGVNYGEKRKLYLFDIKTEDGEYITNFNRPTYYTRLDGFDYVPIVYDVQGSYNMIKKLCIGLMNYDLISRIHHEEGNIAEGVVVRCISMPMLTDETRFIYKVKHPRFDEKVRGEKKNKLEGVDFSPVEPYVNENRAISAMSKFPGYKKHQIGDVMREIVEDVKQEMKKDGLKWDKVYSKFINKNVSQYVVRGVS